jgi:hypothetical protein
MAENLMIVLYVSQLNSERHGPEYLLRNQEFLISWNSYCMEPEGGLPIVTVWLTNAHTSLELQ